MGDSTPPFIAIVDDDAAIRDAISTLLRSGGYRCVAFASAESFLVSGYECDADCLLLDVRMPGMSGLDLHHWINRKCQVPVMYVTASTDPALRARAFSQGAFAFFTKPFEDQDLLDAIHSTLGC